ncbi:MAG: hypothetical protein HDR02_13590 [Lachnospiraceae bacterium]|nr:hypothetical protein [Lachnospiraceae bacterium]
MSSNLLKQGYGFILNGTEEKRVIDTNELAARRLEKLKETMGRQAQDEEFVEGFVQGIEAVDVSALLDSADEGSNVLKADSATESASVIQNANAQAEEILEDARARADRMMQDAQEQAENLKRTAAEEGRMSGYREGKEKADAEVEGQRRQLKAKEAQLEADYQSALDQMEPQLVEAITGIYEHIFHVELQSYRDILIHLIASTLHKAEGSKVFLVHVSKEDYSFVSMQKKQLQAGLGGNGVTLEIIEDATIDKDACMIETEGGIFDCGLGTQLTQLRQKLRLLSYNG